MREKIAINGVGRIGRAMFAILLGRDDFELTAVNDLLPADELVCRLVHDGVNGGLQKKLKAGEDFIEVDGRMIRKYSEKDPGHLPWKENEIDLVLECTGMFTTRRNLERHIRAGAGHVILAKPGRESDLHTVVYGTNAADAQEQVLSCGSGSANCVGPVMEIIDRHLGIRKSIISTVDLRSGMQSPADATVNGRQSLAAANILQFLPPPAKSDFSMTGFLPDLEGLYESVSATHPSPAGYMADIVICTIRPTSVAEVNAILSREAESERYRDVIGVSGTPAGTAHSQMDPRASVVDLDMTRVVGGDMIKIMSWYDNQWGFGNQIVRTARQLLNNHRMMQDNAFQKAQQIIV